MTVIDDARAWIAQDPDPVTRSELEALVALAEAGDDAAAADEIFSVLMGEDVEQRRSFIQRNARDVRFLDI